MPPNRERTVQPVEPPVYYWVPLWQWLSEAFDRTEQPILAHGVCVDLMEMGGGREFE